MLQVDSIDVYYGDVQVLKGIITGRSGQRACGGYRGQRRR